MYIRWCNKLIGIEPFLGHKYQFLVSLKWEEEISNYKMDKLRKKSERCSYYSADLNYDIVVTPDNSYAPIDVILRNAGCEALSIHRCSVSFCFARCKVREFFNEKVLKNRKDDAFNDLVLRSRYPTAN